MMLHNPEMYPQKENNYQRIINGLYFTILLLTMFSFIIDYAFAYEDYQVGEKASNGSSYAILTNLSNSDPYFKAVELLREFRSAKIIRFDSNHLDKAIDPLKRIQPVFVAIVVKPDTLDLNFAYDILEMSFKLDEDPFTDFVYGFITGATADDTERFVTNIIRAEENKDKFPKKIVAFGPDNICQPEGICSCDWFSEWKCNFITHRAGSFPNKYLEDLTQKGIIQFWGHGSHLGIDGGLKYNQLQKLDLYPAVIFAGPCFSAVTRKSYDTCKCCGKTIAQCNLLDESLVLNFIDRGITGYFGAVHTDRCLSAAQEMEYALIAGKPLGFVTKHTYDKLVMAKNGERPEFPRLRVGEQPPEENSIDFQIHRAASRILLGDPAYQPFQGEAKPPVSTTTRLKEDGVEISIEIDDTSLRCMFVDVFHTDLCNCGTENDMLYITVELPSNVGKIKGKPQAVFSHAMKNKNKYTLRWSEEKWFGKRLLHLQLDFHHDILKKQDMKVRINVPTQSGKRYY